MAWIAQIAGLAVGDTLRKINEEDNAKFVRSRADFVTKLAKEESERVITSGRARHRTFLQRSNASRLDAFRTAQNALEQSREFKVAAKEQIQIVQAEAAARGVSFDSGSPLEVIADTVYQIEKQAEIVNQENVLRINSFLFDAKEQEQAATNTLFAAQLQAYQVVVQGLATRSDLLSQLKSGTEKVAEGLGLASSIFNIAGGANLFSFPPSGSTSNLTSRSAPQFRNSAPDDFNILTPTGGFGPGIGTE